MHIQQLRIIHIRGNNQFLIETGPYHRNVRRVQIAFNLPNAGTLLHELGIAESEIPSMLHAACVRGIADFDVLESAA